MWLSFTLSQYCNDSRYSQSLPLFMFSVLLLSWCFARTCFSFGYIVALNKVVLTSVVINLKATACLILYRSITSTKSIMLLAFHGMTACTIRINPRVFLRYIHTQRYSWSVLFREQALIWGRENRLFFISPDSVLTSAEDSKGNHSFGCKSLWKRVVLVNQPP